MKKFILLMLLTSAMSAHATPGGNQENGGQSKEGVLEEEAKTQAEAVQGNAVGVVEHQDQAQAEREQAQVVQRAPAAENLGQRSEDEWDRAIENLLDDIDRENEEHRARIEKEREEHRARVNNQRANPIDEIQIDTFQRNYSNQRSAFEDELAPAPAAPASVDAQEGQIDTRSRPAIALRKEIQIDSRSRPAIAIGEEIQIDSRSRPAIALRKEIQIDSRSRPAIALRKEIQIDSRSRPAVSQAEAVQGNAVGAVEGQDQAQAEREQAQVVQQDHAAENLNQRSAFEDELAPAPAAPASVDAQEGQIDTRSRPAIALRKEIQIQDVLNYNFDLNCTRDLSQNVLEKILKISEIDQGTNIKSVIFDPEMTVDGAPLMFEEVFNFRKTLPYRIELKFHAHKLRWKNPIPFYKGNLPNFTVVTKVFNLSDFKQNVINTEFLLKFTGVEVIEGVTPEDARYFLRLETFKNFLNNNKTTLKNPNNFNNLESIVWAAAFSQDLKTLNLSFHLTPAIEKALEIPSLHLPNLTHLDVRYNDHYSELQKVLTTILSRSPNLKHLDMSFNLPDIDNAKCLFDKCLFDVLPKNLMHLNMGGNLIDDQGLRFLSDTLMRLENLAHLDVSLNRITGEGVKYFITALKNIDPQSTNLKHLNLKISLIDGQSKEELRKACDSRRIDLKI